MQYKDLLLWQRIYLFTGDVLAMYDLKLIPVLFGILARYLENTRSFSCCLRA